MIGQVETAHPVLLLRIAVFFLMTIRCGVLQSQPDFTFSFSECGFRDLGPPGTQFDREFDIRIAAQNSPDGSGARSWSMSIVCEGAEIVDITVARTFAASVDDDPPGLRSGGFERSELATRGIGLCEGKSGAVTAVVLSFGDPITLPPEGTARVARIGVEGTFPDEPGAVAEASLAFADGCIGSGMSVSNSVTWQGQTVPLTTETCHFELVGAPRHFRRGDANDDGQVNISDPLFVLGCKFLGGICPECRDAGDVNDDGLLDVSDAVFSFNFLFLGGAPPRLPGPDACGPDPSEDALPPCRYSSCGGSEPPFASLVFLGVNEFGYVEYEHEVTGMVLVRLPGGRFDMGSPEEECGRDEDEGPVHRVQLSPFLIAKHEVTQAQWEAILGENPSSNTAGNGFVPPDTDTSDWPVENISWADAQLFASRTGLELPTEAQWEYACRAGANDAFAFGRTLTSEQATFSPSPFASECPSSGAPNLTPANVGSHAPNALGLHDMHGNVAELCLDAFVASFYLTDEAGEPDPLATHDSGWRVVRGGGFGSSADECRSASRDRTTVAGRGSQTGLRLVWNAPRS